MTSVSRFSRVRSERLIIGAGCSVSRIHIRRRGGLPMYEMIIMSPELVCPANKRGASWACPGDWGGASPIQRTNA